MSEKPTQRALRLATESLGKRADLELILTVIRDEDEEQALQAYATWRERYPVNDMDIHAMKLMPRLVARLGELGVEDDESKRLAGIGRYLLLQGHLMMDSARAAGVELMRRGNIETVAIKGVMLRELGIVRAYDRPMVDADLVLMRPGQYVEAKSILKRADWKVGPELEHATTFKKGRAELDLHKFPVRSDRKFELMAVAPAAIDQNSGHVPFRLAAPTASLVLTCLAGMRTDGGALWVFDAEALIQKTEIAWNLVVGYAAARQLVLTLSSALGRVRGVPPHVTEALRRFEASHIEALELRHYATPFDRTGAQAARLLTRLRDQLVVVGSLRAHENEPGLRWDARWEKEWR